MVIEAIFFATADGIDDCLVIGTQHLAEHRVLAVQPRRGDVRDKELAAIGTAAHAGTGIGHGQYARAVVLQAGHDFVIEVVARTTGTSAAGASALNHEVRDHTVKGQTVVILALGQINEIGHRDRRFISGETHLDGAAGGFNMSL